MAEQAGARFKVLVLNQISPNGLKRLPTARYEAAKDLLDRNPAPSETDVRDALASNLCRCGTHNRIVRAVLRAAQMNAKTNGRI